MLMAAVIVARASGDEKIPTVDATPPDTIKHSELHALGEKIRQTIKETVRGFDRTIAITRISACLPTV